MIMGQPIPTKRTPKVITYRPMDNSKITAMANYLDNYNWDSLNDLSVDDTNDVFINTVNYALNQYMHLKKTLKLPTKIS